MLCGGRQTEQSCRWAKRLVWLQLPAMSAGFQTALRPRIRRSTSNETIGSRLRPNEFPRQACTSPSTSVISLICLIGIKLLDPTRRNTRCWRVPTWPSSSAKSILTRSNMGQRLTLGHQLPTHYQGDDKVEVPEGAGGLIGADLCGNVR